MVMSGQSVNPIALRTATCSERNRVNRAILFLGRLVNQLHSVPILSQVNYMPSFLNQLGSGTGRGEGLL